MEELILKINRLKKSETSKIISDKIKEFKENGKKTNEEIFGELSFCLMTANFNAKRSIDIQNSIGDGFCELNETELSKKLKKMKLTL